MTITNKNTMLLGYIINIILSISITYILPIDIQTKQTIVFCLAIISILGVAIIADTMSRKIKTQKEAVYLLLLSVFWPISPVIQYFKKLGELE